MELIKIENWGVTSSERENDERKCVGDVKLPK